MTVRAGRRLPPQTGWPAALSSSVIQSDDGAMWFGTVAVFGSGGVSRYDGRVWEVFTAAAGPASNFIFDLLQANDGAIWVATDRGVSRYDGTLWQTFSVADGLASNGVASLTQSLDGAIWFGTAGGRVSRFEETGWQTLTTVNGLSGPLVTSVFKARDGAIWFGTGPLINIQGVVDGGVARYDGKTWQTFRAADGLVSNLVWDVFQSRDGAMWFGAVGGVSRYDGVGWQTFTTEDGLATESDEVIFQSRDGAMWFGTGSLWIRQGGAPGRYLGDIGGGVSRYDGVDWQTFTTEDGLASNTVGAIFQSRDGVMWFGTLGGVSRYDGSLWQTFTVSDGLVNNGVIDVFQSRDGVMWFGTLGGVSRYDGSLWETFTVADGLASNVAGPIVQSDDGATWFATDRGVSRYDGEVWQTFTTDDGLINNIVLDLTQADNGTMWFGAVGGVSAFKRPAFPLVQTVILSDLPSVLGVNRFFIETRGFEIGADRQPPLSFVLTRGTAAPGAGDWSRFAVVSGFEVTEDRVNNGMWSFHVRAVDRNGNVDPTPASLTFTVDLIAPTVVIASPKRGSGVSGTVAIEGSAFDRSDVQDLEVFLLEYGRGREAAEVDVWIPIGIPQSAPVEGGVLGTWQTEDLQDGDYVLRIRARDALGHRSVDVVHVVVLSALERIDERDGGRVVGVGGKVDLMVPPNGLEGGGEVQIVFLPAEEQVGPPAGARFTGIAYRVGPGELIFNKRSTLTLGYDPVDLAGLNETDLAVFALSGGSWTRLGGTVDETANKISVGIQSAGTYALFEAPPVEGTAGVSDVTCQPRIISPSGGLYPGVTDISFTLGTSTNVDMRIYGVSGNLIREIVKAQRLNAGLNTVQWDGRDRNEQVVRDGIYGSSLFHVGNHKNPNQSSCRVRGGS